jgi:hypothetical protein
VALLNLIITPVAGVVPTEKRSVAFLRGDTDLDAGPAFDEVDDGPLGKRLKHKMGLWIGFKPDTPGKFHRFKNDEVKYRECFVFIDLHEGVRLYGFTCHPLPRTNAQFELCVLVTHVFKRTDHTDKAELDRVLKWKNNTATQAAIRFAYPDLPKSTGATQ